MNRTIKLTYAGAIVAVAIVVALLLVPNYAGASNGFEPCVPKDAYTETVVVTPAIPAVPATEGTPAIPAVPGTDPVYETVVTPATPGQHYVHAHNEKEVSPLGNDEVPPTPEQSPTEWQANTTSEPNGHFGHMTQPDGSTYEEGESGLHYASRGSSGRRDWFYFKAGTPETSTQVLVTPGTEGTPEVPAVPGTPGSPAVPAVTQDIFHPAVVCTTPSETPTVTPPVVTETVVPPVVTETVVPTPTPDDVQTPDLVSVPEKEDEPKATPNKPEPKPVYLIECVDGVFVTTVNGEVVSENGSCVERDENDEPVTFSETGL